MIGEVNKTKEEEFKIVEIKPGVYFRFNSMGNGELTEDITKAEYYEMNDIDCKSAETCAKKWFGKVKTLIVTWEVE